MYIIVWCHHPPTVHTCIHNAHTCCVCMCMPKADARTMHMDPHATPSRMLGLIMAPAFSNRPPFIHPEQSAPGLESRPNQLGSCRVACLCGFLQSREFSASEKKEFNPVHDHQQCGKCKGKFSLHQAVQNGFINLHRE